MPRNDSAGAAHHQLAVHQGDAIAGVVVHEHRAFFVTDAVHHIEALGHFLGVGDGLTAGFGGLVGAVGLDALLGLVTRVTPRRGARHGGHLLAGAATDLVAEGAADHRPGDGTEDLVLILHRLLAGDLHLLADLPGGADGFGDFADVEHIRMGGRPVPQQVVARDHTARRCDHGADDDASKHGFVHGDSPY